MARSIKFYYDFLSPYSYLASLQLPAIALRHDCTIDYLPISVLRLMEKVGNQPTTILCEAKLSYALQDLGRWAQKYEVAITPNPHLNTIDVEPLLRGAIAADDAGLTEAYNKAVFEAYWVEQAAFRDLSELKSILENAQFPGAQELLELSSGLEDRLHANIASAVADGVFGVPSFVCDSGLFFGNDRLDFLEQELAA
ncbi:MAG: 2-hydroxychromene-2-carboxylate isomerase [Pseudomonadota bacterium]